MELIISASQIETILEERKKEKELIELSKPLKMTFDYVPKKEKSLITIAGQSVCSVGNITLIIAPPASGKSNLMEAIASGTVNPSCDTMGLSINSSRTLLIDTERVHNDLHKGLLRIEARSGCSRDEILEKVDVYSFITIDDVDMAKKEFKKLLENGGYELVILDGSADFVRSVNDEEESKSFWRLLISLLNKYQCGCVCTIHPNPTDSEGKATGHLGSQGMKKAESVFNVFKDKNAKEIRMLTTETPHGKVRNAYDKLTAKFTWDNMKGMFVSVNDGETSNNEIKDLLDLFKIKKTFTYKEFLEYYCVIYKLGSESKFNRERALYLKLDRIKKTINSLSGKEEYSLFHIEVEEEEECNLVRRSEIEDDDVPF